MADSVTTRRNLMVVDDDPQIGRFLKRYLERESFEVSVAQNGDEMRECMSNASFDLVILDLTMPGDDGLTLTRELRQTSDIGIIILTGKEGSVERVVGLELGADDYISKPFDERELLARIRSVLRRSASRNGAGVVGGATVRFGSFELNLDGRELRHERDGIVALTTLEFDLMAVLARNPHRVMSREHLLAEVAGRTWSPYDRAVDTAIVKLRRKIEDDPRRPTLIKTVRGVGYMFALAVETENQKPS